MTICGYTIGAKQGYIYIRAEYPLAIERLKIAIKQAKEYGLLGDEHPRLGLRLRHRDPARRRAPSSAARRRPCSSPSRASAACPMPKPPFPAVQGLWKKPTVINNVETFANVAVIMTKGAEWFAKIGTEKSKGTKTFALTGKINNSGLVEVPMGTTLREIIYDIGGGIKGGKKFKGVQTGGPSGGIITEESLDEPITYESLTALGSMMGSGGMIIMDEDDCVVDIAKFYMAFCVDESCGKCAPCRIGTSQMHDLLDKITKGYGTEDDLVKLEKIGKAMTKASLCMLGGLVIALPIFSSLTRSSSVPSPLDDLVEEVVHLAGADAAGRALAAGLVDAEVHVELGDVDDAVVLVHDDHAARAHHRAEGGEALVGDRLCRGLSSVMMPPEGPPVWTPLNLLAAPDAAADVVDDLAQGGAHRHLDEAGVVDLAGEGEDLGALGLLGADLGEPLGALGHDHGDVGEGLDVVDDRGLLPQALAPPGRAAWASGMPRLPSRDWMRAVSSPQTKAPGAEADLEVEVEARAEDVRRRGGRTPWPA